MGNSMEKDIIRIWGEVEDDFPTKSTEFLMTMVCDRYEIETGKRIDHGDVAETLYRAREEK